MSADNDDIICAPAPAPKPAAGDTMIIDRADRGSSKLKYVIGFLFLALIAGAVTFTAMRDGGSGAATSVTATGGEGSSDDVATATEPATLPAECVGEIADGNLRWYCTQFLPFAQKAAADHRRIDRLEAELESSGTSGVPLALWLVIIGIGLLTASNTLMILTKRNTEPPQK